MPPHSEATAGPSFAAASAMRHASSRVATTSPRGPRNTSVELPPAGRTTDSQPSGRSTASTS
eukprot:3470919-Prymnesium_polylepis.1